MWRYVLSRLIQAIFVILSTVTLVFIVLRFVGDPARLLAPDYTSPETLEHLRQMMGLDKPIHIQYVKFLADMLTGNFGESFLYGRPVTELIMQFLPATILLTIAATILSVPLSILVGIVSATRSGSVIDDIGTVVLVIGRSTPQFWLGLILIILFSIELRLLPPSGYGSLRNLIMPALALAAGIAAFVARVMRSSILEVLNAEYVRTAWAKGLSEQVVLVRHVLPNALIPVVTVIGLQVAELLGGAITVEMVFSWPGIGWLLVTSLRHYDFPVIQAVVTIICAAFVFGNLAVDLLYAYIDPRIRLAGQGIRA